MAFIYKYPAVVLTFMTLTSHVISQDRSRASILNSDPIQMGDLGVPPATSTIILY
ncbi:hypothetical protein BgiMline_009908, partial [Biomphalaria glabrata]